MTLTLLPDFTVKFKTFTLDWEGNRWHALGVYVCLHTCQCLHVVVCVSVCVCVCACVCVCEYQTLSLCCCAMVGDCSALSSMLLLAGPDSLCHEENSCFMNMSGCEPCPCTTPSPTSFFSLCAFTQTECI